MKKEQSLWILGCLTGGIISSAWWAAAIFSIPPLWFIATIITIIFVFLHLGYLLKPL